jgi:membrane dipeptidase
MEQRIQKIHEESVVIDACGGLGFAYPEILAGGINAISVTLAARSWEGMDHVLNQIKRYYLLIGMARECVMLVEEAEDILKAKREGKLGIIFGFQNASPIEKDLTSLDILYKLGVRIIQLTYDDANALGCGCRELTDTGLTRFGMEVVKAMNYLGILVDLSHTGYLTSRNVIEISEDPVSFTHANPSTLKDSPRNRPDDLIRMAAEKGGMIGLTTYASHNKSAPDKRPSLEDFLDQIDYVVQLVGVDHAGIGTDMFPGRTKNEYLLEFQSRYVTDTSKGRPSFETRQVEGFSDISQFPRITEGLLSRGYTNEDCGKILGGNFYSLFQRVWKDPGF